MLTKVDPLKQTIHLPVVLRGRATVERELFVRQLRGVRVNDLALLYPQERALRSKVLECARKFIADMSAKGNGLLTAEADMKVYGPYEARNWALAAGNKPARTQRPTQFGEDVHAVNKPATVVGYSEGEDPMEGLADFVIEATFICTKPAIVEVGKRGN